LFVAGKFSAAGGVGASHIARWDGAWSRVLNGDLDGNVSALAVHDDGGGPALYAGGDFTHYVFNGALFPAPHIARHSGIQWYPVGQGLDGPVRSLAVRDADGPGPLHATLFAGGEFLNSGSVPVSRVAEWVAPDWRPLSSGADGTVKALAAFDEGPAGTALYLGGSFLRLGGAASARFGRWSDCACYANCDRSTTPPVLNIADFVCFLNQFAAGYTYANCDNSTVFPWLNVNDFACFVNAFNTGCPGG
jgi:hypothetical protein